MEELTKVRAIKLTRMDYFVCELCDDLWVWSYWIVCGVPNKNSNDYNWKDYVWIAEDEELYNKVVITFDKILEWASKEREGLWEKYIMTWAIFNEEVLDFYRKKLDNEPLMCYNMITKNKKKIFKK